MKFSAMFNLTFSGTQVLLGMGCLLLCLVGCYTFFKYRLNRKKEDEVLWANRTKHTTADVFIYDKTLFRIGLLTVLSVTLIAFNWNHVGTPLTYEEISVDCTLNFDNIEPALCHLSEPPPPPKTVAYLFLPTQNLRKDTSKLFRVVERMPVFGDCNNEPSEQQRRSCSNQALLSFIFKHFRYPQLALETVIEGPVVIHFIIEKDGAMTNLEVIRDPGGDLGSEALRVATLMANRNTWIAGQQNEKPVRVEFNLPLRFHLED